MTIEKKIFILIDNPVKNKGSQKQKSFTDNILQRL